MFRYTLAALALAAGPAAAETMDAAGTGMGVADNEVMEIAEGHMVMKTASIYESFDTDGPFKDASGECFGAAEMMGAEISGNGVCVFATQGDETAVINWHMNALGEGGATMGEWTVSGGTGKWATASGGGTFSNATNPETGEFKNTITGDITFE